MGKQYCRYCAYLCVGNGIWCHKHQRTYSEKYTKTQNNCGDFELNVIDAYNLEHTYQPRETKEADEADDRQITLNEIIGDIKEYL